MYMEKYAHTAECTQLYAMHIKYFSLKNYTKRAQKVCLKLTEKLLKFSGPSRIRTTHAFNFRSHTAKLIRCYWLKEKCMVTFVVL